jgi:hypothetical protein
MAKPAHRCYITGNSLLIDGGMNCRERNASTADASLRGITSFAQKIHGVREKADRHSRAGGIPGTSIAYLAHRLTIPPGLIARFPPARE